MLTCNRAGNELLTENFLDNVTIRTSMVCRRVA